MSSSKIKKELLKHLFKRACGAARWEVHKLKKDPLSCRIIGGYGLDPKEEKFHKDIDAMVMVDDISNIIGKQMDVVDVQGIAWDEENNRRLFKSKPLDVFVCDNNRCLIPLTVGRGIQHQILKETDVKFQESGFEVWSNT